MSPDVHDLPVDSSGSVALGSAGIHRGLGAGPTPGSGTGSPTVDLVDQMVAAWRRGEAIPVEAFLDRHPGLSTESALRLIHEEVCLRQEAGLKVVTAEVVDRFPRWRAQLELLLDCQRLLQPRRASVAPPAVGEVLGEFRLVAELGHGASGPVFLASQDSLAARPVVLKMITCVQEEHLTLARLQHMNIVPLYSEQVIPSRNQRVLCMPYLGGATLARLLERLDDTGPPHRSGKQLIEALDRIQAEVPVGFTHQGPYRGALARSGYVQAIAWIGACLADGLQYAHDRDLVHMDIKPSNVLLTGDGQPMLLDFHLARGAIDPADPHPRGLGGTAGYTSPEQQAAMEAIRHGRPIRVPVDGRSDIYSLGVLLYEALGKSRWGRGKSGACVPLRRLNPEVSTGLSDIIHKCLNADPRDRYARASALASDLRRHLNHLPLSGVPNRSWIERWRKWRQRRPSALARQVWLVLSACGAIAAAALLMGAYRQRLHDLNDAFERSRRYQAARQFAEAEATLNHALALAGPTLAFEDWRRLYRDELRVILRDRKAAELHQLADLVRFRCGLAPRPSESSRSLLDRGRAIWEARTLLLAPIPGRSQPELEETIRTDLLDIITVWADLRVRLAPAPEAATARGEALAQLDEAAAVLGSGPALERLRRALGKALGRTAASGATPTASQEPRTAWEHCDLGCAYLREGEHALAARQFQQAVDLQPRDFWPNFYQGLCSYRLGRCDDALAAFRVCIALAQDPAECYFNRALTYEALGRHEQALLDYTRALCCDDRLTGAALNRGILHYNAGRYPEAAADLDRALATASGREIRGLIQYNRALVELARSNRPAALAALAIAKDCGHAPARELYNRERKKGHN
jgi:serine/threonine protein kinase/tetratricopeptide (TPR) repeat protein